MWLHSWTWMRKQVEMSVRFKIIWAGSERTAFEPRHVAGETLILISTLNWNCKYDASYIKDLHKSSPHGCQRRTIPPPGLTASCQRVFRLQVRSGRECQQLALTRLVGARLLGRTPGSTRDPAPAGWLGPVPGRFTYSQNSGGCRAGRDLRQAPASVLPW